MSPWRVLFLKFWFMFEDIVEYVGNRFFSFSTTAEIVYLIMVLLFAGFVVWLIIGLPILLLKKFISFLPYIFSAILLLMPVIFVIFLLGEINIPLIIAMVAFMIGLNYFFKYVINKEDALKAKKRKKMKIMDLEMFNSLDGILLTNHISMELTDLGIANSLVETPESDLPIVIDVLDGKYLIMIDKSDYEEVNGYFMQELYKQVPTHTSKLVFLNYGTYHSTAVKIAKSLNIELINMTDIRKWDNVKYKRKYKHIGEGLYWEIKEKILKRLVEDGGAEE